MLHPLGYTTMSILDLTQLSDAHVINIPSIGIAYVDPRSRQTNQFWVYYGNPTKPRSSYEWSWFENTMLVQFTEEGKWRFRRHYHGGRMTNLLSFDPQLAQEVGEAILEDAEAAEKLERWRKTKVKNLDRKMERLRKQLQDTQNNRDLLNTLSF